MLVCVRMYSGWVDVSMDVWYAGGRVWMWTAQKGERSAAAFSLFSVCVHIPVCVYTYIIHIYIHILYTIIYNPLCSIVQLGYLHVV